MPLQVLNIDDIENHYTRMGITILKDSCPLHSFRNCNSALKMANHNISKALCLLPCEDLFPVEDSAFSLKQEPSPNQEDVQELQPFPFMKLPPEVRLMIYRQHLATLGIIDIRSPHRDGDAVLLRQDCGLHQPPHCVYKPLDRSIRGLLTVSKAVYNESVLTLYRHNTFHFPDFDALYRVLRRLHVECRHSILSISLYYSGGRSTKSIRLLQGCIGLRRLSLIFNPYSLCDRVDAMEVYGLEYLREIRGIEELKITQEYWRSSPGISAAFHSLEKALQVLKQPRPAAQSEKQKKRDSSEPAYGRPNVMTRSRQRRIMGMPISPSPKLAG